MKDGLRDYYTHKSRHLNWLSDSLCCAHMAFASTTFIDDLLTPPSLVLPGLFICLLGLTDWVLSLGLAGLCMLPVSGHDGQ